MHERRRAAKLQAFSSCHEQALLFLIPAYIVMIMITGRLGFFVTIGGFAVSYVFELLNRPEWSFFTAIGAIATVNVLQLMAGVQLIVHSLVYFCLVCVNSVVVCCVGAWLALQFPWLRYNRDFLPIFITAERLVFSISWIAASATITWTLIPYIGMSACPTALATLLSIGYYMFGTPHSAILSHKRMSSDDLAKQYFLDEDHFICRKVDNIIHTLVLTILPAIVYMATKHRDMDQVPQLLNLGALFLAPFVMMKLISSKRPLWWTALGRDREDSLLSSFSAIAVPYLLFWAQYQSLYGPFAQYIAISPPWSYITFTSGASALVFLIWAHQATSADAMEQLNVMKKTLAYGSGVLVAITFSILIGVPFLYLPLSAACAFGAMSFYFNKGKLQYFTFAGFLLLGFQWFFMKNLAFINYQFFFMALSLHAVYFLILILFGLSLIIPALVATRANEYITAVFTTLHGVFLATVELILYSERQYNRLQRTFSSMYPLYMIILTTLAGVFVYQKLFRTQRITLLPYWLMLSVYIGKLATCLQVPLIGVYLAITLAAVTIRAYFFRPGSPMKDWNARMELAFYLSVGLLTFLNKSGLLYSVVEVVFAERPSSMLLHGFWLIVWGCLNAPVAFRRSAKPFIKVVNTGILLIGLVMFFVQPETGESFVLSLGFTAFERWMAMASFVILGLTLTRVIPIATNTTARLIFSLSLGFTLGVVSVGITAPVGPLGRPTFLLNFAWSLIWQMALLLITFTIYPVENAPEWFPKNCLPLLITTVTVVFINADSNLIEASHFRNYTSLIAAIVFYLVGAVLARKSGTVIAYPTVPKSIFSQAPTSGGRRTQTDRWAWTTGGYIISTILSVISLSIFMLRRFGADWAVFLIAPTVWYLASRLRKQPSSSEASTESPTYSILAMSIGVMVYLYAVAIGTQLVWPLIQLAFSFVSRYITSIRYARAATTAQQIEAIFTIKNAIEAALATLCFVVDGLLLALWMTRSPLGSSQSRTKPTRESWFKLDQVVLSVAVLGISHLAAYFTTSQPTRLLALYGLMIAIARVAWSLRKQHQHQPHPRHQHVPLQHPHR